jgi:hypothetical protein
MPGEKQNEIKAKLDGMSTLPEEFCFNPEQTWRRLNEQLNRPKKKYLAWIYAAAIILLIAGSFFVIQIGSQNRNLAVPIHYPSKSSKVKTVVQPKKEEEANNVIVHYVPTAKNISHSVVKVEQTKPLVDSIVVEQPIAVFPSAVKVDSVTNTIAIVKSTKFRIAHINELNTNEPFFDLPKPKAGVALLNRRNISELTEPTVEEKALVQRKQKTLFSFLISSSQ